MNNMIELLHTGGYSCVISNGNEIRTFTKRGVADLYELIKNDPSFLNGSSVADKIVGKAAAALMILSGVSHIYADIISEPAIALIKQHTEIELKSGKTVPFIENRDKSGICPLENRCNSTDSLQELFVLIEKFIHKMSH
ncbi:MAG: DUF1893 domain-containing protein [Tannerella sp.]|jgi:iron complex outermembrane receptor protein/vitamin B12 transporter|nr:DUF1893 domain-containing protein [Tannerella sp.]